MAPNTNEPTDIVSPQARVIQRLLWASLILTLMTLACSLATWFGFLSMFINLGAAGGCLILDITLLALSAKERRRGVHIQTSNGKDEAATIPPSQAPGSQGKFSRPALPCTCRKPAIGFAFLFMLAWMAGLGFLLYFLIRYDALETYERARMASPILESIFTIFHIGVLATFIRACIMERRRLVSQERELKWYQLGDYQS